MLQDCMCAQRRLRSACTSAQADQSLRCPPEDTLDPWVPRTPECPVKTLIRLYGYAQADPFAGCARNLVGNAAPRLTCPKWAGLPISTSKGKEITEWASFFEIKRILLSVKHDSNKTTRHPVYWKWTSPKREKSIRRKWVKNESTQSADGGGCLKFYKPHICH